MPLTERVNFTTSLQKGNRVQVSKLIRWRFKLESDQTLKVGVNFSDLHMGWKYFYAKMSKDGRLTVPKLVLSRFQEGTKTLTGLVVEVILDPA